MSILSSLIIVFVLALEALLQIKASIRNLRGGERTIPGVKYCYDAEIKPYGYCSLITHTKDVSNEGLDYSVVEIYVDKLGGRVDSAKNQNIDPKNFNNFLIGDSFVQADEVPFANTIQGLSRKYEKKRKAYLWNWSGFLEFKSIFASFK